MYKVAFPYYLGHFSGEENGSVSSFCTVCRPTQKAAEDEAVKHFKENRTDSIDAFNTWVEKQQGLISDENLRENKAFDNGVFTHFTRTHSVPDEPDMPVKFKPCP